MSSVGVKTPTEPKLYLFFSILRHFEQDEVDVMCLFIYYMGGKIRRLSMNVGFKYICKKIELLSLGRIVYL
jgi:hypothetical protein